MCCVSYLAGVPKQFCSLADKGNSWVSINVFLNSLVCDRIANYIFTRHRAASIWVTFGQHSPLHAALITIFLSNKVFLSCLSEHCLKNWWKGWEHFKLSFSEGLFSSVFHHAVNKQLERTLLNCSRREGEEGKLMISPNWNAFKFPLIAEGTGSSFSF